MTIAENIQKIKNDLPAGVKLIAVSKTRPDENILEAYMAGQRCFGENRAQEMASKFQVLPADIEWHFIGHLQSNKVRYIAPFVSLVQSVDSLNLLEVINHEAVKNKRIIPCLLEIYIAKEETKSGLSEYETRELLKSEAFKKMTNIRIDGVMGMATFTDDMNQVRQEFRELKKLFDDLRREYFGGKENFRDLSMGMSSDYPVAIEEGSTMVRIGTSIFGERNYMQNPEV